MPHLYDDRLVIILEDVETALAEAGFGSDLVSLAVPKKNNPNQIGGFGLFLFLPRDSNN